MINVILKHFIYEKAIEVVFSGLKNNFNTKLQNLKQGDKFKWIEVRLKPSRKNLIEFPHHTTYFIDDVYVMHVDNIHVTIKTLQFRGQQMSLVDRFKHNEIVGYELL